MMDVGNNNNTIVIAENETPWEKRRKAERRFLAAFYHYASILSLLFFAVYLVYYFIQLATDDYIFSDLKITVVFFARIILRFVVVPYNYIFEVYPILQKRKGLTVDKNDILSKFYARFHGSFLDFQWIIAGSLMDFVWIIDGSYAGLFLDCRLDHMLDNFWIIFGSSLDFAWIIFGSSLDFAWILFGSFLDIYGSFTDKNI